MNERVAFGLELRRIRERRGLSLEQMCGQTKVSVAHYAALESGDLSRWPSGIFRRAFVRSYATAVGLNPEEVLAEFGRIFPDPADGPRAAARIEAALREQEALAAEREAGESEEDLPVFRLALDPPRPEHGLGWFKIAGPRLAAALVDVFLALMPAAAAGAMLGRAWFLPTAAAVGFLGHIVYYSVRGATPGSWVVAKLPKQLSQKLSRVAIRRRQPADEGAAPRRRFARHSTSHSASHAHRVQH